VSRPGAGISISLGRGNRAPAASSHLLQVGLSLTAFNASSRARLLELVIVYQRTGAEFLYHAPMAVAQKACRAKTVAHHLSGLPVRSGVLDADTTFPRELGATSCAIPESIYFESRRL